MVHLCKHSAEHTDQLLRFFLKARKVPVIFRKFREGRDDAGNVNGIVGAQKHEPCLQLLLDLMHDIVKNIERDKNIFLQQIQGNPRVKNLGRPVYIIIGITAELTAALFHDHNGINLRKLPVGKDHIFLRGPASGPGILTHHHL